MGRGLSELQKGILGVACTVNAHLQGGVARLRAPVRLGADGSFSLDWLPPPDGTGPGPGITRVPCDYRTPLGVCLLYRIAPSPYVTAVAPRTARGHRVMTSPGFFADSPAVWAAKTATLRAARRLLRRGLLVPSIAGSTGGDYLLTRAGLEAGRSHARPVPLIAETLCYFAGIPTTMRRSDLDFDVPAYCRALAAAID
jgi:hypothetical protein